MGLDISSTTVGICVLSYDVNNLTLDHVIYFKPPKKGNLFKRLAATRQFIIDQIDKWKPDAVAIEDIVLFMKSSSSANTIVTLAILNRVIGLSVFDKLGHPPYLYNIMRIRHSIKKEKILPPKSDIPDLVGDILNVPFPYIKNKKGEYIKENGDMADAIACGICHVYADRSGKSDILQIKKKKRKKKVL